MGFGHEKQVCGALAADENTNHKALLDCIVAMLTKLGQRGYAVHEDRMEYTGEIDPDTDSDPDPDGNSEKAVLSEVVSILTRFGSMSSPPYLRTQFLTVIVPFIS